MYVLKCEGGEEVGYSIYIQMRATTGELFGFIYYVCLVHIIVVVLRILLAMMMMMMIIITGIYIAYMTNTPSAAVTIIFPSQLL